MIIVTGASGGIGQVLIQDLQRIDDVVVGTYFKNKPAHGECYELDVTQEDKVADFIKSISRRLTRVTLVNLAGISIDKISQNLPREDWDKVLAVNLTGAFLMSRQVLPYMMKERWGRIINVSSVVAQMGMPGTVAYAAAKSGLLGLTKTLAKEYASYGIRVNCLSLGYFSAGLIHTIPPGRVEQLKDQIPVKKLGEVNDIALAIEFLVKCEYITGATIPLSGGLA